MKRKHRIQKVMIYLLAAFLVLYIVLPLAWMFLSSISSTKELLRTDGGFMPEHITLERYKAIFSNGTYRINGVDMSETARVFKTSLKNSCIVAGTTTLISLILGGMAGYAFARMKFRMQTPLFFAVLFLQMLPPIALILPYYMIIRKLGVMDRLATLIIIYSAFIVSYAIWIFYGYFKNIPKEMVSAALIDGCSHTAAFWKVVFPSALPGFVAVGALSFLLAWDEFMYALIFTNTDSAKTIPVAISEFGTRFGVDYGLMMTGGVLAALIPLLLAVVFQRYIVSGLTAGAVKE